MKREAEPDFLVRVSQSLERHGKSQADLARALGVDKSAISRLMSGHRRLRASEMMLIQEYLRNFDNDFVVTRVEAIAAVDDISSAFIAHHTKNDVSDIADSVLDRKRDAELCIVMANRLRRALHSNLAERDKNNLSLADTTLISLADKAYSLGLIDENASSRFKILDYLARFFAEAEDFFDFDNDGLRELGLMAVSGGGNERPADWLRAALSLEFTSHILRLRPGSKAALLELERTIRSFRSDRGANS